MQKYTSKYPKIITDASGNSVNEGLKKIVTIEEWYDISHHTHDISTLSVSDDGVSYDELVAMVNELQEMVKTLQAQVSNMPSVGDWDVETPGNQDANGNTLGTLLGFDLTEIDD